MAAHPDRLAAVLGLAVSDLAGVAIAYESRAQRLIRKLPNGRSPRTDYWRLWRSLSLDLRADILAGFEADADAIKKENGNGTKETTAKKAKNQWGQGENGGSEGVPAES